MIQEMKEEVIKLQKSLPLYARINELTTQEKILQRKMNPPHNWTLIIITYILVIVLGGTCISFFAGLYISLKTNYYGYEYVLLGGYSIPLIGSIFVTLIIKIKNKKKRLKLKESIEAIHNEIGMIFQKYDPIMNVLPAEYRYHTAVNFIQKVLVQGRADSIKEAMNLYEEQIHRWKVEDYQKYMTMVANQQSAILKAIKKDTRRII